MRACDLDFQRQCRSTILSFFADFTYEGSRSIIGPATLQASGAVVGIVTGFGELLGYSLRLFSGNWADATGHQRLFARDL